MNSEKLKGHILILITNILFAVNMPISKYLLPAHVPPEGLTIMRMAFACVMFWIVSLFTVKEKVPLKDLGMLFVCALCGVGINQGLFIVGLNRSSPVDASIIATAVPIFVLLLAAVILKEPITRKKSFGVFMGVSGGLLLVFSSTHAIDSISSLDGDMMMIVSGLMYAIYLVLSKPLSLRYSSVTMMKWMFLFTTLTLVPFTFRHVLDAPAFHREVWDFTELGAIFYVLFGATFLPYLLIPMSLKRIRPTTVSMYNYVQPLVAVLFTVAVGLDTFGFTKGVAALCVFAGVWLVTKSKSRAQLDAEKAAAGQAPENRPRA
jgi:drug/metabolite transporter (DMT)-like permease